MDDSSQVLNGSDCVLLRALGAFDASCIVVGAIIGVGIFFTPSQVARVAGGAGLALTTFRRSAGSSHCSAR